MCWDAGGFRAASGLRVQNGCRTQAFGEPAPLSEGFAGGQAPKPQLSSLNPYIPILSMCMRSHGTRGSPQANPASLKTPRRPQAGIRVSSEKA